MGLPLNVDMSYDRVLVSDFVGKYYDKSEWIHRDELVSEFGIQVGREMTSINARVHNSRKPIPPKFMRLYRETLARKCILRPTGTYLLAKCGVSEGHDYQTSQSWLLILDNHWVQTADGEPTYVNISSLWARLQFCHRSNRQDGKGPSRIFFTQMFSQGEKMNDFQQVQQ
ncbi:hypothetical protein ACET3Z_017571 [Daucus carota]